MDRFITRKSKLEQDLSRPGQSGEAPKKQTKLLAESSDDNFPRPVVDDDDDDDDDDSEEDKRSSKESKIIRPNTNEKKKGNVEFTSTDEASGAEAFIEKSAHSVVYDVGLYLGSTPDDFTKYKLLTDHWVPEKNYIFPFSSHLKRGREEKRKVNHTHFDKYPWLVFSDHKKGLLCKYCALFCQKTLGGKQQTVPLKKLVTEPLQKFAKLTGKDGDLEVHSSHEYHKSAEIYGRSFIQMYENPQHEIVNVLDEKRKMQILENRARLAPVVKTVILHGRQNIPLRGHRDDGRVLDLSEDLVLNDGNFRALLRFRVESGDVQLENHLHSSSAGATYVSKTTTNELIHCCGEEILEEIIRRVNKAEYFSVMFDETTDVAHVSQLSISLRYVHENAVREDFIAFIDIHKLNYSNTGISSEPVVTGSILGQSVLKCLHDLGLNLEKCAGVGCDGCSVNISDMQGAVAEIKKEAKNSILCVCKNHCLNLSLSKCSKVQSVRNAVGCIKEISTFFNMSAKRNYVLKNVLEHKMKGFCETRWVQRHESVMEFREDLPKIAEALSIISSWNDSATASKAKCLLNAITNCEFVVAVYSLSDILSSTVILSKFLQDEDVDVCRAAEKVNQAICTIQEKRTKSNEYFSITFEHAKEAMEEMDIDVKIPRIAKKQQNRPNYSGDCKSEEVKSYWERSVYIPVIDHVLSDLRDRFKDESVKCFCLNDLIPTSLDKLLSNVKALSDSVNMICEKFSPLVCQDHKPMGLKLFNEIISLKKSTSFDSYRKVNKAVIAYEQCDGKVYPMLKTLLKVLATLPISIATAERSFSTLRRVKTWMRSRMTQERLTGLALLHVHKDIYVNVDNVIDRFASKKSRKIEFVV